MRSLARAIMSSLGPKVMHWVGQTLAQAGPWPTATRSEHRVHLVLTKVFFEIRGMSNGQPATQ